MLIQLFAPAKLPQPISRMPVFRSVVCLEFAASKLHLICAVLLRDFRFLVLSQMDSLASDSP